MGKRSKNYQKNRGRKAVKVAGYTKGEKIMLIVLAAVIVVGILCAVLIPKIAENIKYHPVATDSSGAVSGLQDNWLVANVGTSSSPKYCHLANAEPLEGFSFVKAEGVTDDNVRAVTFASEDGKTEYSVMAVNKDYATMTQTLHENISSFYQETISTEDILTEEIGGVNAGMFVSAGKVNVYYDEDGNEITPETDESGNEVYPTQFEKSAYCYIESPIEGMSVVLFMNVDTENESDLPESDAMLQTLRNAISGVQFVR